MNFPTGLAVTANWLAYAPSMGSGEILAGCGECARDLAGLGVSEVELPIAHLDAEVLGLGLEYWGRVRAAFAAEGLRVRSVHGPIFSYDARTLGEERERMGCYARAAVELGAAALVVHPVFHSALHVCAVGRAALERDVALGSWVGEELRGSGCRLAIENVPHNSWAYLEELFRRLPAEVGMCFDTGHYQVRPERRLDDVVVAFADRIACVHVNDNHGLCDEHLPPGEGAFRWDTFREVAGGVVAAEVPCVVELSLPALADDAAARDVTMAATKHGVAAARRAFSWQ